MLKSIPPEEKKTYVTLYRTNGYSYTLTLLAIIAEFVYVTTILDSMPVNFWMGLTVIVNIFVLFLVFTCAVKINVYSSRWAVITLAVGVYFLVRQFLIVPVFLQPYAHETILLVSNDRIRSLNHRRSDRHSQGEKTPGSPAEARAYWFIKSEACRANGKNSIQKR